MTSEQWIGVLIMGIGVYFIVCSIWFRDFVLYKLKVQRAIDWYGEDVAHVGYLVVGIVAFVGGIAKLAGAF